MRTINLIVVHCSATRVDHPFTEEQLLAAHLKRGFRQIGYHFYIRRDGRIVTTRPLEQPGAHAKGYNAHSIGICYEGGLDADGNPDDTRTSWQRHSLRVLIRVLLIDYPDSRVCGHRDLSADSNGDGCITPDEWQKKCPCFDVGNYIVKSIGGIKKLNIH